ncbi:hypothetical protein KFK09_026042 [Dendrobium nobile]|uniref:Uncharacterized protein n=1 Tax=Dendrobium nobile TaxID=94219 RepID=A0A8T3A7I7_DENNO|nr:hypothetical protein KFK09_026042 [Dendrobium nobile]
MHIVRPKSLEGSKHRTFSSSSISSKNYGNPFAMSIFYIRTCSLHCYSMGAFLGHHLSSTRMNSINFLA